MKITEVKVFEVKQSKKNSTLKAFASVTFDKEFVVKNLRIIDGEKGLFVAMPSQLGSDNKYYDIAFPITAEFREKITDAVLKEYED